jgi:protein TonB
MLAAVAPAPEIEPPGGSGILGSIGDDTGSRIGTGPGVPNGDPNGTYDGRGGALPADLVLPLPLETPAPRYPDLARIVRKEGAVVLSATIAADGSVLDIQLEKGMGPLLDQAAIDAVSRWRYVPARIGERRVAVILRVTVTFRLL